MAKIVVTVKVEIEQANGGPDHYWQLTAGETVYLDEPSMTLATSEPVTEDEECE